MRFIYLSTTNGNGFQTEESTINSFKAYLSGECKFHITERKIDKNKFDNGEDIFFLRAEKEFGYYTYKIVAYCRAGSNIEETEDSDGSLYPYYFRIDSNTLKIFLKGIDIKYFQNFVDDLKNNIKPVKLTGSIKNNSFTGPQSWIYFDKQDSDKIMKWFKEITIKESIQMLCNL